CLGDPCQGRQFTTGKCPANITRLSRKWFVIIPQPPPQLRLLEDLTEKQDFLVDGMCANVLLKTLVLVQVKILISQFLKLLVAEDSSEMLQSVAFGFRRIL